MIRKTFSTNDLYFSLFLISALVLSAFLPYLSTLGAGFVNWDDNFHVTENDHVLKGLTTENVKWAFSTTRSGFYYPVTWLSHMLDVTVYGLRPWGHHLTSVVIHVLNTLLLFLFLKRSIRNDAGSFIISALFAVHPLNVESVAWISERKNLLAAFFFLLGINLYLSLVEKPTRINHAKVIASFLLGLMSKSVVVVFPLVLCLIDIWPLKRVELSGKSLPGDIIKILREKVLLFIPVPIFACITIMAQSHMGALSGLQKFPFGQRLAGAVLACGSYLCKFLFPVKLAAFNPHLRDNYSVAMLALSAAALFSIVAVSILVFRKNRLYLVSFCLFLLNLLPVSGLIQVGNQASADRYMYIPMIGLLVIFVLGAESLFKRAPTMSRNLFFFFFVTVFVLFAARTWDQEKVWRSSEDLFTNMMTVSSNPSQGYTNMGHEFKIKGDSTKAIDYYRKAISADPMNAGAYTLLGEALCDRKDYKEADESFRKAWELDPGHPVIAGDLAYSQEMLGNSSGAAELYEKALSLDEFDKRSRLRLAFLLQKENRPDEAIKICEEGERIAPDDADYPRLIGSILLAQKRYREAEVRSGEALRRFPGDPSLLYVYNYALRYQ